MDTIKFEFPLKDVHVEYGFKSGKDYDLSTDEIKEVMTFIPYAIIKEGPNTRSLRESMNRLKASLSALSFGGFSLNSPLFDTILNIADKQDVFSVNLLNLSEENLFKIMSIDPKEWKLAKSDAINNFPDSPLLDVFKKDIKNFEEKFSPELKLLLELEED